MALEILRRSDEDGDVMTYILEFPRKEVEIFFKEDFFPS